MTNVSQWSTTAASNNSASPDGWPEGMAPSGLNNSARENMAALAKWYGDISGSLTTGGTSTAYTLTTNSSHAALGDIGLLAFEVNQDCGNLPTLNVDSLGAKTLTKGGAAGIRAGELRANHMVLVLYESGNDVFEVLNPSYVNNDTSPHQFVWNEGGEDIDFRIESDTQTHQFFSDASTNRIGINESAPEAQLHITEDSSATRLLLLEDTDATTTLGPNLVLRRAIASPNDDDQLGNIEFTGNDSGSNETTYAQIYAEATDVTNTSEDGRLFISVLEDGSKKDFKFGPLNPGDLAALFIPNGSGTKTTPSGGGQLYVESGALKYKGSSGTETTLGNA